MSSSDGNADARTLSPSSEERPFHHGNLRSELVEAAASELEKSGYEGLSLRHLAKMIGVSRAAPYRHFKNREALLKELSVRWTVKMNETYRAIESLDLPPRQRLAKACMAYLASAKKSPELYRLIFASPQFWDTRNAKDVESSTELVRFRKIVSDASRDKSKHSVNEAVMLIGCVLHGYAMLHISGQLDETLLDPVIQRVVMQII